MSSDRCPDDLQTKVDFYSFLLTEGIDLSPKGAVGQKAKKGKGKAKVAKEVKTLKRPLVAPLTKQTPKVAEEKFYITTAISYTNGPPHTGHAYEAVTTDIIARYNRVYGRNVFFLTGTDEHGQKVEEAAKKRGLKPIDICDMYAKGFKDLDDTLNISYDYFIRTTQPHHENLARTLWLRVREKGDIYVKPYVGWYNVHEEEYVTDLEADRNDYKDQYGRPYEKKEEESYFFRMSKYQQQLVDHINNNPEFCQPSTRRAEILSFLKEPLLDLCISRTVCQWGVKCPFDPEYKGDKSHVMYVWFDALSNYLSGIGYLKQENDDIPDNSAFWPAVHIIGKDITRFHCVIWPTMLMAAGIELPKCVFGHGFVSAKDGRKMSKSLGNSVNVEDIISHYPVDAFRFYLAREAAYGTDLPFNEETLCSIHNAVLVSGVGNLLHRSTSLCASYCEGKIPQEKSYAHKGQLPFKLKSDLVEPFEAAISIKGGFQLQAAAEAFIEAVNATNKFLQDVQPWAIKDPSRAAEKRAIVRTCLEAVYILAHFLTPFAPAGAARIFDKLGVEQSYISCLSPNFDNLPPGTVTYVGEVLYDQLFVHGSEEEKKAQAKASGAVPAKKKADKGKAVAKKKQPPTSAPSDAELYDTIDIRVGKIVKAWHHETAEALFCEEIDVGEEKPREIASGLRKFYKTEDLQDRLVLVICNLKPAKLKGFKSCGMVLCASTPDKVEFIEPPAGAKIGERVFLTGRPADSLKPPAAANAVAKKKYFVKVAADLQTDSSCVAVWKGKALETSKGPCKSKTLTGVPIK